MATPYLSAVSLAACGLGAQHSTPQRRRYSPLRAVGVVQSSCGPLLCQRLQRIGRKLKRI